MNKASKLDLAERTVFLKHLQEIAHDDVDSVRKWKEKHYGKEFAVGKGEDETGIVVCDDYHYNDPPKPPASGKVWPITLSILAAGLMITTGVAIPTMLSLVKNVQPPVSQPESQKPPVTIEKNSGFILDLPDGK